ncbi:MAG: hypothetical protein H8E71_00525 [Candidatus Marinimicrobia bacterium]|nr:hypothetical protein [Candidatus Neomarinimicrobiota bacterium]
MEEIKLNKLILHPEFYNTIEELRKVNVNSSKEPIQMDFDFSFDTFPPNGKLKLLTKKKQKLDFKNGEILFQSNKLLIGGYDESTWDFMSLEGSAFITSHSYVLVGKNDYIPINYLTNYFYTRSELISNNNNRLLIFTDDPKSDAKSQYATDRSNFLEKYTPENSILFVDGPMIGGQMNHITREMVECLNLKNISPIFFVKNSTSNLVTDNVPAFKGKYNSDMHWSSKELAEGEITNFFIYEDQINNKNSKIFFYFKPFIDTSPQRIELHLETYNFIKSKIMDILDLIYFLILVNGDKKNPQIRPIAIAEKYARETLKIIDYRKLLKTVGLIPTMNQERGFN